MLKVMTIVGTRPELIKMSRVVAELDNHFDHVLVHSGQNYDYELNKIFFDELGIRKPDHFLGVNGNTAAKVIAQVLERSDEVLEKERPDALMLYGDTNTCLAVLVAKRRKIPIFHMEAGNRCFDERVPEEINRKVVDHLSDVNLVLTEHARRYLLSEGLPAERIIKTGSHMQEVLDFYMPRIQESTILNKLNLRSGRFFLVSAHREENVDVQENLEKLLDAMSLLAEEYDVPVLVSTHPRTRKRIDSLAPRVLSPLISFAKPFGFIDYVKLQMSSLCVLSDSGTITEESSLLGFPAVTLRNAHERPEGMDEGTLIMSGLQPSRILESVRMVVGQVGEKPDSFPRVVGDYLGGSVSRQIARIVLSYTDYVNRTVWSKTN